MELFVLDGQSVEKTAIFDDFKTELRKVYWQGWVGLEDHSGTR